MRLRLSMLLVLIFVCGMGALVSRQSNAQSRANGALDLSLKSCADFSETQYHLDAAQRAMPNSHDAEPNATLARDPIRLERPVIMAKSNRIHEFLSWYAGGGQQAMLAAGEACRSEMLVKSGEAASLRAGFYIAEQRARNAEFFANSVLKQYTGQSLY